MAVEAPAHCKNVPSEYILRKYLLMLATLVATVTYGGGFSPPGGVWQASIDGHLAGDSIVLNTNNLRYLVFFYCNAFALASSVLVIVLFLLLSIDLIEKKEVVWIRIKPLRVLMVLDLLSFMGAYAAGSCRDMLSTVYTSVLMAAGVFIYLTVQVALAWASRTPEPSLPAEQDNITVKLEERLRKVLILLATFAVSITYVSGLNLPGGFWDNTEGGHRLGGAILIDGRHKARLTTFFICNTTAFMASLLIIMLLLGRKLHERTTVRSREMFGCVVAVLLSLVGAYAAGSCREAGTTVYVVLVVIAGLGEKLYKVYQRVTNRGDWEGNRQELGLGRKKGMGTEKQWPVATACRGRRGGPDRSGHVHAVVASGHGLARVVASPRFSGGPG
ncbi:hypothetical protein TRIUR3_03619 [Triticum urartu]|uniref:PGG domain-containing protein n=1 Tax=Triticum urartu TaxID=4572 RepID=M7ZMJ3_TRIUA|nr:hypothetical protein TRIUR3_03619 [Triticum urartu]